MKTFILSFALGAFLTFYVFGVITFGIIFPTTRFYIISIILIPVLSALSLPISKLVKITYVEDEEIVEKVEKVEKEAESEKKEKKEQKEQKKQKKMEEKNHQMEENSTILDSYASYLALHSITYSSKNGFAVHFPEAMVWLASSPSGMITLSTYVGLVNFIRPAKRLVRELEKRWPRYKIWPEKFTAGYFEIEVEYVFPYTTTVALHEEVMVMAQMAVDGYKIGKEIVGEEFCR